MVRKVPGRWTHHGYDVKSRIVDGAHEVALVSGLASVTFGRLARASRMSKSNVFEHFRSKLDLQLAVVERVGSLFDQFVLAPARMDSNGALAVQTIVDRWLTYEVGGGGAFLAALWVELGRGEGELRETIVQLTDSWFKVLRMEIEFAQAKGQIDANEDSEQLAFELLALVQGSHWVLPILGREKLFKRARDAVSARLQRALTPKGVDDLAAARTAAADVDLDPELESGSEPDPEQG